MATCAPNFDMSAQLEECHDNGSLYQSTQPQMGASLPSKDRGASFDADYRSRCAYRKSYPQLGMVQTAEVGNELDPATSLDRVGERRVFA